MLSEEKIEELYFEILFKMKIFEDADEDYYSYLNGCADILEKVLEIDELK